MNFPLTIVDQQELNRLISAISQETADKTAEAVMLRFGKISQYMKKSECIRLSSERKVNKAIATFELPYVMKGKNIMILRSDFNKWQTKHTL